MPEECLTSVLKTRIISRARLKMYDIKVNFEKKHGEDTLCPFCQKCDETFEHIFQCPERLICPEELQDIWLVNVADGTYYGCPFVAILNTLYSIFNT